MTLYHAEQQGELLVVIARNEVSGIKGVIGTEYEEPEFQPDVLAPAGRIVTGGFGVARDHARREFLVAVEVEDGVAQGLETHRIDGVQIGETDRVDLFGRITVDVEVYFSRGADQIGHVDSGKRLQHALVVLLVPLLERRCRQWLGCAK
ncbi:MAG: hypothetical protein EA404_14285 [Spirochaetaceae bacterium]|nr:MAG: hypothetical protein EA404_14285 [Spirochaetaceae bacterium]